MRGRRENSESRYLQDIIRMRTNPVRKDILAGFSCLHNYFLRTEYVKAIIKGVRFELLLI